MGLDLSLRSSAACVIEEFWKPGEWADGIATKVVGYGIKEKTPFDSATRLVNIVTVLVDFARWTRPAYVYVEDYAYGLAGRSGMVLAELGGAVKYRFMEELGVTVVPVNMSTARKYLLGKLPPRDRVEMTHRHMNEIGCPFGTSDEKDAWIVANYGRTEAGLPGLSLGGT